MASSLSLCLSAAHPRRFKSSNTVFTTPASPLLYPRTSHLSFCSNSQSSTDFTDPAVPQYSSKQSPLKPGLYLVGTPIGNLEDITLRALRVLKSADVILSEDTRHSGKLLQHYNIKTPLLSFHKFNESQREHAVLKKLREGEIVAQISDAGTPGISDPGMALVKLCVNEKIPVIPIPGPSALVAGLSASGLATDEFTFVGFLPKHAGSRRERLIVAANETATQIFFVPPHKLCQFIEDASSSFSEQRQCVIAREMTKIHEEFWRGTLGEAKEAFSTRQPKGEITFLIEGKANVDETPSESQLENELREVQIASCHQASPAVKLVASGTSVRRKVVYSLALRKFGKQVDAEDD
ncbi:hypothetical protein RHGRI_022052 [Rhododendron griersonianum]|uniref:Tetrapyrrole methylase domain-containing protein n=1 Tax=Rhododendron griersonianum TaxID=479676 RepID=A0AAV6JRZ5_9ERIC|nr:hypothetical protein RHGRI_022052 [Rhododendron griersonianum]